MRQAGLKPKSHNSGVYWVRASANPGGAKAEPTPDHAPYLQLPEAFRANRLPIALIEALVVLVGSAATAIPILLL